jgi:hypothetical protein
MNIEKIKTAGLLTIGTIGLTAVMIALCHFMAWLGEAHPVVAITSFAALVVTGTFAAFYATVS